MDRFVKKIIKKTMDSIDKTLIEIFNYQAVPEIKRLILGDYDLMLNGVAKPKSLLAPERLIDKFEDRLNQFHFVRKTREGVILTSPDIENFDFKGTLDPIKNILEGLSGKYVEVSRDDYKKVTKKQTYRGEYKKVYLIRYTYMVRKWEKTLNKKFEAYPFSNTPPIDIFNRAERFVEDNIETWIDEAITKS